MRFLLEVDVDLPPAENSVNFALEILEFLVKPENLEKFTCLKNIELEGTTTDVQDAATRTHYNATAKLEGLLITRKIPIKFSYVQDSVSPIIYLKYEVADAKYFTNKIQITELRHHGDGLIYLEIKCDIVYELSWTGKIWMNWLAHTIRKGQQTLLDEMKMKFEKSTKQHPTIN